MSPNKEKDDIPIGDGCPALPFNIIQQKRAVSKENKGASSKPHPMKNYCSNTEHYDTLHHQVPKVSKIFFFSFS